MVIFYMISTKNGGEQMKNKRYYQLIVIFTIILVVFINTMAAAFAASLEDIQNQINNLQTNKNDLQSDLNSLLADINAQKEKDKIISQQMAEILAQKQQQASELEKMLDDLEYIYEQIAEYNTSIEKTEKIYNEKLTLFYNRARVMYQYAKYDSLKLFVESKDIFDFANRDKLFARMLENDRDILEELSIMKQDLEAKKAIQNQLQLDAEAMVREKEAIIEAIKNKEQVKLDELEESRHMLELLESQEENIRKESQKIEAEIRRQQELYQQQQQQLEGELMWPTRNTRKISSYFGMRMHPIYGYPRMHTGLDISAAYGTDILSSADGVVTNVIYNEGGYGWYITVYHGDGISTLYAHCSKVIAKVGQEVKKGQVIAIVGSTGASTGPHIHYEVRLNGTPVDPLKYVNP